MSSIIETSLPKAEPVTLQAAKDFLRLGNDITSDGLIQDVIIPGARRLLESQIGIVLANRTFIQSEPGFPFFPYFQSPFAALYGAAFPFYFGYGPISSYPYPAIGGLQNQMVSPFEIRLLRSPVTAVEKITYVGTDGALHDLSPGADFVIDWISLPARLIPLPGQRWPVSTTGLDKVRIYYSAGYVADETEQENITEPGAPTPPQQFTTLQANIGMPEHLTIALLMLVTHWYQNRDPVIAQAGGAGKFNSLPLHVQDIIDSERILDFGPPR
jgi:hypothetical protein